MAQVEGIGDVVRFARTVEACATTKASEREKEMQIGIDRTEDYLGRCETCGKLFPEEDLIYTKQQNLVRCVGCISDEVLRFAEVK